MRLLSVLPVLMLSVIALVSCENNQTTPTVNRGTPTVSPIATPTATGTPTPIASPTSTVSPTPTATATGTPTPTTSPPLTATVSPTPLASTPSPTQSPIQLPTQTAVPGQPIILGKYQFTVNGLRQSPGDLVTKPEKEEKFLVFDVTVENKTQTTETISSFFLFQLMDSQGQEYERAITSELKGSLDKNLAPGKTLKGEVAFKVPKNVKGLLLVLKGDLLDPGLQAAYKVPEKL